MVPNLRRFMILALHRFHGSRFSQVPIFLK
jgi:hypothetical protein